MSRFRASRMTSRDIERIVRLREQSNLPWAEIAQKLGRSPGNCRDHYVAERSRRFEAARRAEQARKRPPIVVPVMSRPPAAPRAPCLEGLRERAELAARIAERGLTGGIFGDPAPGRSALDQRASGAREGSNA